MNNRKTTKFFPCVAFVIYCITVYSIAEDIGVELYAVVGNFKPGLPNLCATLCIP